jgi:hypothetical protein
VPKNDLPGSEGADVVLPVDSKCFLLFSSVSFFRNLANYTHLLHNFMKLVCIYCDFKNHIQSSALVNENLKKKLEDSEAENAWLRELMAQ